MIRPGPGGRHLHDKAAERRRSSLAQAIGVQRQRSSGTSGGRPSPALRESAVASAPLFRPDQWRVPCRHCPGKLRPGCRARWQIAGQQQRSTSIPGQHPIQHRSGMQPAVEDHRVNLSRVAEVRKWIGVEQDQVSPFARLNRPSILFAPRKARGVERRRLQRLQRGTLAPSPPP